MRAAALAFAASLALAACGGGDDPAVGGGDDPAPGGGQAEEQTTDRPAGAGGGKRVVDMNDQLAFAPRTITIEAGQEVTWRNVGNVAHTVTADKRKATKAANVELPRGAKPFDSGFISGKKSYKRTFEQSGTYRYICIPHEGAGMVGTVIVK